MLNAFLWLSGICLCQALTPEFKSASWNCNRKDTDLWQKQLCGNPLNQSRPRVICSYPSYRAWPSSRRKPFLKHWPRFYPYYTDNPYLNKLPFFKNFPVDEPEIKSLRGASLQEDQLMNDKTKDSRISMPKSLNKVSTSIKNQDKSSEKLNIFDYPSKYSNDSCFRISKKETMIISPTILIGRKNKTCTSDDWILSNKPINILLKKLPKTRNILRIENKKRPKPPTKKFYSKFPCKKMHKKSYEASEDKLPLGAEYEFSPLVEETINIPEINKYENSSELEDDEDSGDHPDEDLITLDNFNKDNVISVSFRPTLYITHPIKKKVTVKCKTEIPYVCEIDVDELNPDEEGSAEHHALKMFKHGDEHRKKMKRGVRIRRNHTRTGQHMRKKLKIPNILSDKHFSKRSCREEMMNKRRIFHDNLKNFSSFEPDEFGNYYEYVFETDDMYPDDEQLPESLYINEYEYYPLIKTYIKDSQETTQSAVSFCELTLSTTPISISTSRYKDNKPPKRKHFKWKNAKNGKKCKSRIKESRKKFLNFNDPDYELTQDYISKYQTATESEPNNDLLTTNMIDEYPENVLVSNNLTLNYNPLNKFFQHPFNKSPPIFVEVATNRSPINIMSTCSPNKNIAFTGFAAGNCRDNPVLDEMFVSPNKAACEVLAKHRCACSPQSLIHFFSYEIQKSLDAKLLLKKLITFSCEQYFPLDTQYRIASDMKPRLISKKRKELIEDKDSGPKEINPISFDELMMRGIPREGVDIYVFPSTTVEIPCFTSDEMKLSPNIADSALYKWSHSNLKAITEGRILEDANHRGSLIIQDVTLADSDNYTCSVQYVDPDTQDIVKQVFIHAVKVVVLPRLALHTNLHYIAIQKCDQELLEMFELYLPQQIQNSICGLGQGETKTICTVEIHNPVCYTKSKQDEPKRSVDPRLLWRTDFQKSRWIREILIEDVQEMEMSLNYELDLGKVSEYVPEALNWSHCSPHCQQKISLKTIEILRESFLDALLLPVKSNYKRFEPVLSSINIKLLTACDGGLELKDGFCVPCKNHFYSEHGKTICLPCPAGTYQDNIGAKSCISCPHPFRPNCFYVWSFRNFVLIFLVTAASLTSVGLCFLICLRVRRRNRRRKSTKKVKIKVERPEPLPPDFE